ncbi:MAG: glycosyltransferase [Thermaerobacter sp.]|nr:glycosyltransferase [Thermaerobacter sp.]
MRILVISALVPAPPDRGDRIRGYEMLQALSEFGEVHLALIGNDAPSPAAARSLQAIGVRLQRFPVSTLEKSLGVLGAMLSGRPWGTWRIPRVAKLLGTSIGTWDVVVGFQLKSAYYADKVQAGLRILELTDSLGLYRKALPALRNPLRWLSLSGAAREEARWACRFAVSFLCSEQDADEIVRHRSDARIRIVANGADCWGEPVSAGHQKDSLVFIGSLFYPPNRDGLRWFLQEIWPRVAADHPEIVFRVVGEGPKSTGRWVVGPRVSWTGYLSDLTPEYERALALVNPIRYGTGTRRKILYAWGAGVPVISTSEGAHGLAGLNGEHLLIADLPSEFQRAVSELAASRETWLGLSRSGWELARERYAPKAIWHAALSEVFSEGGY